MNKLAAYYRLIELADRMRRDGLDCPRCGHGASSHPVQIVGAAWCQELWVPAAELDNFNKALVGSIEVVKKFGTEATT